MKRILRSRVSVVILLVSVLLLIIGVSAVRGSELLRPSGSTQANVQGQAEIVLPVIIAAYPITVEVKDCTGNAKVKVAGSGWNAGEVVLITLVREDARLFVGSGFANKAGAFVSDVTAPVIACGAYTLGAKGDGGRYTTAPLVVTKGK